MSRYDSFTALLSEVAATRKGAGTLTGPWLAAVTRSTGTGVLSALVARFGARTLGGLGVGVGALLGPVGFAAAGALAGVAIYKALSKGGDERMISRDADQIARAERLYAELQQLASVDSKAARRQMDRLYEKLVSGEDVEG